MPSPTANEMAVDQVTDGVLDGPLGQADDFGEHLVAHRHGFPSGSMGMPVQLQIDKESGTGATVGDQIAHQSVDYVRVGFHTIVIMAIAGDSAIRL